jgi:catechol 2,3-dioxygenase-like lactoylglutathione lyase family enzyme
MPIGRDEQRVSPVPGIDHIVLCVRNLDAARDRFRSMGFTLTPPATHPFGTGNSLAQLKSSFIELLSVVDPERIPPHADQHFSFAAHNAEFLSRGEGMSMLVISSEDARADEARWRKAGLTTFEPVYFERGAQLPDGSEAKVAFTIAFALNEEMPNAVFFCCQQHKPEAFWHPQYQRHPNGAMNFASITLAAEDPRRHAPFFAALLGAGSVQLRGDALDVVTASGKVEVIPPQVAARRFFGSSAMDSRPAARFVAAGIRTADLGAADACLERGGIQRLRKGERIIVPAAACCGMALEFVQG